MRGSNFKSALCRRPSHASLWRRRKAEAVSGKVLLGSRFSIKFKQGLFTFAMINFHRGKECSVNADKEFFELVHSQLSF